MCVKDCKRTCIYIQLHAHSLISTVLYSAIHYSRFIAVHCKGCFGVERARKNHKPTELSAVSSLLTLLLNAPASLHGKNGHSFCRVFSPQADSQAKILDGTPYEFGG